MIPHSNLNREKKANGRDTEKSHAMLGEIAMEVMDYCEHEDCTTLQAVQLMKCRLQELEIAETRRRIRGGWAGVEEGA